MLFDQNIPNRQKDEKLILFLRRHPLVIAARLLFIASLGLVPPAFYYFFYYFNPGLLTGSASYPFLLLFSSIYYLYLDLYFLNAFIDYNLDVWIVTNKRIINIEQKGILNREVAEHSLEKIQDVSGLQKGFFPTFFTYGDVHVQTAGEIQRFVFRQVDNPFEVVRVINDLIQKKEDKLEQQIMSKLNREAE